MPYIKTNNYITYEEGQRRKAYEAYQASNPIPEDYPEEREQYFQFSEQRQKSLDKLGAYAFDNHIPASDARRFYDLTQRANLYNEDFLLEQAEKTDKLTAAEKQWYIDYYTKDKSQSEITDDDIENLTDEELKAKKKKSRLWDQVKRVRDYDIDLWKAKQRTGVIDDEQKEKAKQEPKERGMLEAFTDTMQKGFNTLEKGLESTGIFGIGGEAVNPETQPDGYKVIDRDKERAIQQQALQSQELPTTDFTEPLDVTPLFRDKSPTKPKETPKNDTTRYDLLEMDAEELFGNDKDLTKKEYDNQRLAGVKHVDFGQHIAESMKQISMKSVGDGQADVIGDLDRLEQDLNERFVEFVKSSVGSDNRDINYFLDKASINEDGKSMNDGAFLLTPALKDIRNWLIDDVDVNLFDKLEANAEKVQELKTHIKSIKAAQKLLGNLDMKSHAGTETDLLNGFAKSTVGFVTREVSNLLGLDMEESNWFNVATAAIGPGAQYMPGFKEIAKMTSVTNRDYSQAFQGLMIEKYKAATQADDETAKAHIEQIAKDMNDIQSPGFENMDQFKWLIHGVSAELAELGGSMIGGGYKAGIKAYSEISKGAKIGSNFAKGKFNRFTGNRLRMADEALGEIDLAQLSKSAPIKEKINFVKDVFRGKDIRLGEDVLPSLWRYAGSTGDNVGAMVFGSIAHEIAMDGSNTSVEEMKETAKSMMTLGVMNELLGRTFAAAGGSLSAFRNAGMFKPETLNKITKSQNASYVLASFPADYLNTVQQRYMSDAFDYQKDVLGNYILDENGKKITRNKWAFDGEMAQDMLMGVAFSAQQLAIHHSSIKGLQEELSDNSNDAPRTDRTSKIIERIEETKELKEQTPKDYEPAIREISPMAKIQELFGKDKPTFKEVGTITKELPLSPEQNKILDLLLENHGDETIHSKSEVEGRHVFGGYKGDKIYLDDNNVFPDVGLLKEDIGAAFLHEGTHRLTVEGLKSDNELSRGINSQLKIARDKVKEANIVDAEMLSHLDYHLRSPEEFVAMLFEPTEKSQEARDILKSLGETKKPFYKTIMDFIGKYIFRKRKETDTEIAEPGVKIAELIESYYQNKGPDGLDQKIQEIQAEQKRLFETKSVYKSSAEMTLEEVNSFLNKNYKRKIWADKAYNKIVEQEQAKQPLGEETKQDIVELQELYGDDDLFQAEVDDLGVFPESIRSVGVAKAMDEYRNKAKSNKDDKALRKTLIGMHDDYVEVYGKKPTQAELEGYITDKQKDITRTTPLTHKELNVEIAKYNEFVDKSHKTEIDNSDDLRPGVTNYLGTQRKEEINELYVGKPRDQIVENLINRRKSQDYDPEENRRLANRYADELSNMEKTVPLVLNVAEGYRETYATVSEYKLKKFNNKTVDYYQGKSPYLNKFFKNITAKTPYSFLLDYAIKQGLDFNNVKTRKIIGKRERGRERDIRTDNLPPEVLNALNKAGHWLWPKDGTNILTIPGLDHITNNPKKAYNTAKAIHAFSFWKWMDSDATWDYQPRRYASKDDGFFPKNLLLPRLYDKATGLPDVSMKDLFKDPDKFDDSLVPALQEIIAKTKDYYTNAQGMPFQPPVYRPFSPKKNYINDAIQDLMIWSVDAGGGSRAYKFKKLDNGDIEVKTTKGAVKYNPLAGTNDPKRYSYETIAEEVADVMYHSDEVVKDQELFTKYGMVEKEKEFAVKAAIMPTKYVNAKFGRLMQEANTDGATFVTKPALMEALARVMGYNPNKVSAIKPKYHNYDANGNMDIWKTAMFNAKGDKFTEQFNPGSQGLVNTWSKKVGMVIMDSAYKGVHTSRVKYHDIEPGVSRWVTDNSGAPVRAETLKEGQWIDDPKLFEKAETELIQDIGNGIIPDMFIKEIPITGETGATFINATVPKRKLSSGAMGIDKVPFAHVNSSLWQVIPDKGPQAQQALQNIVKKNTEIHLKKFDAIAKLRAMTTKIGSDDYTAFSKEDLRDAGTAVKALKDEALNSNSESSPEFLSILSKEEIATYFDSMLNENGEFIPEHLYKLIVPDNLVVAGKGQLAGQATTAFYAAAGAMSDAMRAKWSSTQVVIKPDLQARSDIHRFAAFMQKRDRRNKARWAKQASELEAEFIEADSGIYNPYSQGVTLSKEEIIKNDLKPGDKAFLLLIPTDDVQSLLPVRVTGMSNDGTVSLNSEYAADIMGRDFDIDKLTVVPIKKDDADMNIVHEYFSDIGTYKASLKEQQNKINKMKKIFRNGANVFNMRLGLTQKDATDMPQYHDAHIKALEQGAGIGEEIRERNIIRSILDENPDLYDKFLKKHDYEDPELGNILNTLIYVWQQQAVDPFDFKPNTTESIRGKLALDFIIKENSAMDERTKGSLKNFTQMFDRGLSKDEPVSAFGITLNNIYNKNKYFEDSVEPEGRKFVIEDIFRTRIKEEAANAQLKVHEDSPKLVDFLISRSDTVGDIRKLLQPLYQSYADGFDAFIGFNDAQGRRFDKDKSDGLSSLSPFDGSPKNAAARVAMGTVYHHIFNNMPLAKYERRIGQVEIKSDGIDAYLHRKEDKVHIKDLFDEDGNITVDWLDDVTNIFNRADAFVKPGSQKEKLWKSNRVYGQQKGVLIGKVLGNVSKRVTAKTGDKNDIFTALAFQPKKGVGSIAYPENFMLPKAVETFAKNYQTNYKLSPELAKRMASQSMDYDIFSIIKGAQDVGIEPTNGKGDFLKTVLSNVIHDMGKTVLGEKAREEDHGIFWSNLQSKPKNEYGIDTRSVKHFMKSLSKGNLEHLEDKSITQWTDEDYTWLVDKKLRPALTEEVRIKKSETGKYTEEEIDDIIDEVHKMVDVVSTADQMDKYWDGVVGANTNIRKMGRKVSKLLTMMQVADDIKKVVDSDRYGTATNFSMIRARSPHRVLDRTATDRKVYEPNYPVAIRTKYENGMRLYETDNDGIEIDVSDHVEFLADQRDLEKETGKMTMAMPKAYVEYVLKHKRVKGKKDLLMQKSFRIMEQFKGKALFSKLDDFDGLSGIMEQVESRTSFDGSAHVNDAISFGGADGKSTDGKLVAERIYSEWLNQHKKALMDEYANPDIVKKTIESLPEKDIKESIQSKLEIDQHAKLTKDLLNSLRTSVMWVTNQYKNVPVHKREAVEQSILELNEMVRTLDSRDERKRLFEKLDMSAEERDTWLDKVVNGLDIQVSKYNKASKRYTEDYFKKGKGKAASLAKTFAEEVHKQELTEAEGLAMTIKQGGNEQMYKDAMAVIDLRNKEGLAYYNAIRATEAGQGLPEMLSGANELKLNNIAMGKIRSIADYYLKESEKNKSVRFIDPFRPDIEPNVLSDAEISLPDLYRALTGNDHKVTYSAEVFTKKLNKVIDNAIISLENVMVDDYMKNSKEKNIVADQIVKKELTSSTGGREEYIRPIDMNKPDEIVPGERIKVEYRNRHGKIKTATGWALGITSKDMISKEITVKDGERRDANVKENEVKQEFLVFRSETGDKDVLNIIPKSRVVQAVAGKNLKGWMRDNAERHVKSKYAEVQSDMLKAVNKAINSSETVFKNEDGEVLKQVVKSPNKDAIEAILDNVQINAKELHDKGLINNLNKYNEMRPVLTGMGMYLGARYAVSSAAYAVAGISAMVYSPPVGALLLGKSFQSLGRLGFMVAHRAKQNAVGMAARDIFDGDRGKTPFSNQLVPIAETFKAMSNIFYSLDQRNKKNNYGGSAAELSASLEAGASDISESKHAGFDFIKPTAEGISKADQMINTFKTQREIQESYKVLKEIQDHPDYKSNPRKASIETMAVKSMQKYKDHVTVENNKVYYKGRDMGEIDQIKLSTMSMLSFYLSGAGTLQSFEIASNLRAMDRSVQKINEARAEMMEHEKIAPHIREEAITNAVEHMIHTKIGNYAKTASQDTPQGRMWEMFSRYSEANRQYRTRDWAKKKETFNELKKFYKDDPEFNAYLKDKGITFGDTTLVDPNGKWIRQVLPTLGLAVGLMSFGLGFSNELKEMAMELGFTPIGAEAATGLLAAFAIMMDDNDEEATTSEIKAITGGVAREIGGTLGLGTAYVEDAAILISTALADEYLKPIARKKDGAKGRIDNTMDKIYGEALVNLLGSTLEIAPTIGAENLVQPIATLSEEISKEQKRRKK